MTPLPLDGISILLVDDHAAVRMGFRLLLEGAGATVLAEAECGEEALRLYPEHRPALVVMDVTMPGLGGLGTLPRLLAHHPDARVLMLSAHADTQIPTRALRADALGYISKRARPEELVRAATQVARGKRYIDPELAPRLALAQLGGTDDPTGALTDKEFSVFLQLARGRSVNEVAEDQHLSASTVGTHLYHIKQKLNAANAAELALIAVRGGLIEV